MTSVYTAEVRYPVAFFSVPHIIFLAVIIPLAWVLGYLVAKKYGFSKKVLWIGAIIGLLCEIEKILFFIEGTEVGYRLPASHIPVNMCPMQVILMFILALSDEPKKFKKLLAFMYPTMVAGGFIGMFFPSAVNYYHGLLDVATYRYFFYHGMVMFMGFFLYFTKPIPYNVKDCGMSLFLSLLYTISGVWINAFFGWDPEVNHMFVVRPPLEGIPILNLDNGWGVYMLQMSAIALVLFPLCFLPAFIRETPEFIKSIKNKIRKTPVAPDSRNNA